MTTKQIADEIIKQYGDHSGSFEYQSSDGKVDVHGYHHYDEIADPCGFDMEQTYTVVSNFTIDAVYLAVDDDLVESTELKAELEKLL